MVTKYALNRAHLITLRENVSYGYIRALGINNPNTEATADKAFLLEPVEKNKALQLLKKHGITENNRPLIGITAVFGAWIQKRGLVDIPNTKDKYEVHVRMIAEVVDYLTEELGADVIFFPHSIGPDDKLDDRKVAASIVERVKNKSRVVSIEEDYSPQQLKGMIGRCDFFIGERTHSVIAAASQNIPFVMISRSQDFRTHGIVGDMLGQQQWVVDIDRYEEGKLLVAVKKAWESREKTHQELIEIIPDMIKRSMLNGELLKKAVT